MPSHSERIQRTISISMSYANVALSARLQKLQVVLSNFFWVLNVAIISGWLLYRRHTQQQKSVAVQVQLERLDSTSISEKNCRLSLFANVLVARLGQMMRETNLLRGLHLLLMLIYS